ncbi:hypothetical protein BWP39_16325 [Paraburkholderia acidicola]|uniref:Uncharacterized protein n=1 Tax=Paraburkholderia acidicola TaxID=1912599 RepID=A0A2A4F085_9BURK|nr:hypothetical protein BWP39_16325 [Paraburkholderia acidicola]
MPQAMCDKHGSQPAELVTRNALDVIRGRVADHSISIHPVILVYEELEYSGFATNVDLIMLQRVSSVRNSVRLFRFEKEDAMLDALGLFTAICARCLAEAF